MVLLAASIPTLRPLMNVAGPSSGRSDAQPGTYTLQNLKKTTFGSFSARGRESQFLSLGEGNQAWPSDERLNVSVGQGSIKDEDYVTDGINKRTTVTVSA